LDPTTLGLLVLATSLNGVLAGGSVEKSLVELPARKRMDILAFVQFSRAADLGRGIFYFPVIGITAPVATIAAATKVVFDVGLPAFAVGLSFAAAIFSAGHLFATSRAAPRMLSLRNENVSQEEAEATYRIFERWQAARAILQLAAFLATLAVLVVLTS